MSKDYQSVLTTLLGRELRRLLFNPLIIAATAVLLAAVAMAGMRAADAYGWNRQQYEQLTAPREDSPIANLTVTAIAPPSPLQVIARGAADVISRPVSAMRQLEAAFNIKYSVGQERRQKELVYSLAEDIDPLMAVRLLLPILAMLLTYNTVCGEREEGTLRLMLAGPLLRRTILVAKLLAAALTLAVVVALVGLAVLTTLWFSDAHIPAGQVWRLVVMLAAVYLYGLVFAALGALVSASVRSSDLSILACLALWCLLVIVAPGASSALAQALCPTPPTHQVYAEKLALERNLRGGDALEGSEDMMRRVNARALELVSEIDSQFFNSVQRQEALARLFGLGSPALNLEAIVTAYAGSSVAEEHELIRQLRLYFARVSEMDDVESDLFAREEPDELERFEYKPLGAPVLTAATLAQWGALVVTLLVLLAASFLMFNRYDVR